MIRSIDQRHANIDHRIAGDNAFRHGLHNALFHGGSVLLGNDAAHNPVGEFETAAPGEGFDLQPGVAELPAAAGLFLLTPLHGCLSLDRLFVRDLRGLQVHFEPEFPLHLFHDHFDVDLAQTRENHLPRLVVPMEG